MQPNVEYLFLKAHQALKDDPIADGYLERLEEEMIRLRELVDRLVEGNN